MLRGLISETILEMSGLPRCRCAVAFFKDEFRLDTVEVVCGDGAVCDCPRTGIITLNDKNNPTMMIELQLKDPMRKYLKQLLSLRTYETLSTHTFEGNNAAGKCRFSA